LISLRNISTILVIDAETKKVKFISIGRVMRQHDPDFIPGDKISVLDNRSFTSDEEFGAPMSRVVEFDARTGEVTTGPSMARPAPTSPDIGTVTRLMPRAARRGNISRSTNTAWCMRRRGQGRGPAFWFGLSAG